MICRHSLTADRVASDENTCNTASRHTQYNIHINLSNHTTYKQDGDAATVSQMMRKKQGYTECNSCEVTRGRWHHPITNKKHLKNVGPIRHCEPPHCHSPGVATVARRTVARRLRIDVHNNNNDNA